MSTRALPLALVWFLLAPIRARADIAPPPPESLTCPRGAVGYAPPADPDARDARGRPLQPFPYCAPSTCTSDADCDGGRVCSTDQIGLCVEAAEQGGVALRRVRDRGCEPDGTCLNLHSTCERARRCVAPEADPEPTGVAEAPPAPADEEAAPADDEAEPSAEAPAADASGCACRATPRSGASPLALLGLALWAWRRRP